MLAGAPRSGIVLDPFGGAATTALVAMQEGRQSVLCELNPEYAALARQRLDTAGSKAQRRWISCWTSRQRPNCGKPRSVPYRITQIRRQWPP